MPRATIELEGPYYGREGFWSYCSDYPSYLEARSVAFEVSVDRQGEKFKGSVRAPVHFHHVAEEREEFESAQAADDWAKNWLRNNSRILSSSMRLPFIDKTGKFFIDHWQHVRRAV